MTLRQAHFFAPNRIDLAGGTLDIYPLYIFEDGGLTVNAAISVGSRVSLVPRSDSRVRIYSFDLGETLEAPSIGLLTPSGPLDLVARAVKFYWEGPGGLEVLTRNDAPKGSGLGASSSLLMALSTALVSLQGASSGRDMRREIIDWGANLEARSLGIPTGKQDYFAAVYGGIGAIWFDTRGERREGLALSGEFLRELEGRLILIFTGISHFSGTNNWNMMKRYIDGKGDTVERMRGIRDTAFRVRESLLSEDMEAFARGISIEWENRKGLARGVTTRRIDRLVDFLADEGATASKICGAGGGGCLLSLAGKGRKEKIVAALKERGYMVMDFHLDHRGVSEADEPAGALRAPS